MIHIYTLHFKDDYWVDLQVESFRKHIKVPYKSYAIFSHMDEKMYDKHKGKFDYFEVREKGKHIHKGGNYHATDGNRDIIPIIKRNMAKNDVVIRIDSDAFFINDIDDSFIDKVKKDKFIAMHEPQHEWDLDVKTPHPAFYCFLGEYLDEGLEYPLGEIIGDVNSNWWGGVESWMSINSIDWKPLSRTNKVDLHPIYFGIYGDLVYHHWAGSRVMITRPDRKRSGTTGLSIDTIKKENQKSNEEVREKLLNELDTFMEYLRGNYDSTDKLPKVSLSEVRQSLSDCEMIINKYDRIADGVNQGRAVYKGDGVYYKIFHKDYCRRENFVKALKAGFFDEVAPALQSLIEDNGEIVGYSMEAGETIGMEFDKIPPHFYHKILSLANEKKMFFYDLVSINIIKTKNGELSLIDLESVYDLDELYTINKHNAVVKPDYYFTELEKLWKKNMKKISFIQPSRNNLKYLKWSYNSIRKNLGPEHEICWADDFSDDGTWDWMNEIMRKDENVQIMRNDGPDRLGHTILYDKLVDMATNDIVMIYHADMYACPNMDVEVLKHLQRGKVVSATRIEPPLHPDGPEKILQDFGIEPEEFDELGLMGFLNEDRKTGEEKITEGIFAPWAIYKEDFLSIGGHDPLYAPQSKEDSDIFNRFQLAGYDTIQTWQGFVYHMTCRGSRFKDGAMRNPAGQVFMKGRESSEWLAQNLRSTRNFIRKWGHMVKHDEYLKPIVPPKYDIGFVAYRCDKNLLRELEPWCSKIYLDSGSDYIGDYIKEEQPDTQFDLNERVKMYGNSKVSELHDICVEFDCRKLNANNFQTIVNLSEIIQQSGETGIMEYDIFKFYINSMDSYEKDLIIVK